MATRIQRRGDGLTPDYQFFTIAVVMTTLAGFFVLLRLGTRLYMFHRLAWEDYFIAIAMLFGIYATIFDCLSVKAGLGIHNDLLTTEQLQQINKWYYFAQAPYKFGIGFTKLSILTLYYRVFVNSTFRRILIGMMVYVSLYTLSTGIATILQCVPVERAWNKSVPGSCVQPTAQWYSFAGLNISAEVIMFILPMPMIKKLRLPRQQKVGLFFIFALGLFVIFCSVMRLIIIGIDSKANDTNYTWRGGNRWTSVELNTGFICASIPVLKAPFSRVLRYLGIRSRKSPYSRSVSKRPCRLRSRARDEATHHHASSSVQNGTNANGNSVNDSSEEFIVGKNEWELSEGVEAGITKTTSVSITYSRNNSMVDE